LTWVAQRIRQVQERLETILIENVLSSEAIAIDRDDSAIPAEMSRMLTRWSTEGLLVCAGPN
jgi:hypothetical protein